jgi:hemolysin activation/secretion protein
MINHASLSRKYGMMQTIIFFIVYLFFFLSPVFAQTPTPSSTAGGVMRQQQDIRKMKNLENKITTPIEKPEELIGPEPPKEDTGEKILIKKIVVEGVTLLPQETVARIVSDYEGTELSMLGMQMVADLITDEYLKNGFVTSRAYIPPQTIKDGGLIIRVVEGRLGAVEIKGNRFFRTSQIKRNLELPKSGYFDYTALQRSLTYINEHPDRKAKAILIPGKEPGTTDIMIDVKDRLPIHVGFNYDDYLSRYLGHRRRAYTLEDNNLLGFDDKFLLGWQDSSDMLLKNLLLRYVFPVKRDLDIGCIVSNSETELGREFDVLDARGEAFLANLFTNKVLIKTENFDLRWNTGYDYKDIKNYLFGEEDSRDRLSILKTGLDFDFNDRWGRNIITPEVDFGIPHILGAMNAKDDHSSRGGLGSGGEFIKWLLFFYRLQPGPFSSEILFKSSMQFSNNNLVAGEQFQIGGPGSVRGYPLGEFSGDQGIYSGVDWALPLYFIPKTLQVPFMNRTFYESLRLVAFYDWGGTYSNRTATASEKDHHFLQSWGMGFRINLGENLFARVEFGVPLSNAEPTNDKNVQTWFELVSKF